jgi:hypothetical protein
MIRHLVRTALCAALLLALPAAAEELRTTTLYRTAVTTKNIGYENLVVRDVAGDARPEIVSCVNGFAVAYAYNGTTYGTSWYSPYVGCTGVAVADRDGDGRNEVIVGTSAGTYSQTGPGYLYAFDASSFRPELAKVQVSAADGVNDVAAGNTDADPGLEVVALTANNVYIYDAATFTLKWSAPYGGHHVAIADIDGDGQNEIIIAGNDGHVLNGYTHGYKWGYVGGFGNVMAVGDVDNDGKPEIVATTVSSTKIIHGDTLTTTTLSAGGQSVAIGDANNDGLNELVLGHDQWGNVEGYTAAGTKLWTFNNPRHGVQGVAVGDPDGDGKNQLIWGAGASDSGADVLYVGDVGTQTLQFSATDLDGSFAAAVGDLNGDGRPEIVLASYSTWSGYDGGAAYVLDGATRRLLATLTVPLDFKIQKVVIGQTDGDAAKEIIMAGTKFYDGYIYVFDGVTFANEWSSPAPQCCNATQIVSNGLIVRDLDGDGIDEIIYATNDYKFHVLNGASSFIKYTSPALDSYIQDMSLADVDGDGVLDLVVGTGSSVYVYKTSDWSQRTHITNSMSGVPRRVAAAPGHFAFTSANGGLITYSGSALTQEWSCTAGTTIDLAFVTLAGRQRLAAAMPDSTLRLYPTGGASCPAYDTISSPLGYPTDSYMTFADVDGDGRPELLFGTFYDFSITALGWQSEARGDVDGDGLVVDADIDALSAYFYGARTGVPPSADVNADGAVRPDDLFYLINYRRGTGAAPPQ